MKVSAISSLLLVLGLSTPMFAIERPPSLDEKTPQDQPSNRAVEIAEPEAIPQADEPAPAWLGVFGESAGEALTAQLGVDGGVVLRYVAEESPAAAAGLKVHDLLTSIDGEGVATQDELRAKVQECQPGDEIRVGVVSGGVKSEKTLKLVERPAKLMGVPLDLRLRNKGEGLPGEILPDLRRQMEQMGQLFPNDPELQKQLEEQMKRAQEQLKDLEKMPGFRRLKIDEMLKDLPKQKEGKIDIRSMASVELSDEEGSVKLRMRNGGQEVEVRNKAGELLYEGPWDNDQDKAAVAPEIRERIENLNFQGMGNGMKFHLRPGPGMELDFDKQIEPEAGPDEEKAAPDKKADDAELE